VSDVLETRISDITYYLLFLGTTIRLSDGIRETAERWGSP
jgi:hypothetical protein